MARVPEFYDTLEIITEYILWLEAEENEHHKEIGIDAAHIFADELNLDDSDRLDLTEALTELSDHQD